MGFIYINTYSYYNVSLLVYFDLQNILRQGWEVIMAQEFQFSAQNTSIREVLFNDMYKFKVPRYQRPYTWKQDQLSDFWEDVNNTQGTYFLGPLIFNNEEFDETGFIDIIDGQQRLLTITIFSAVLRDIATPVDSKLANLIQSQDIAMTDRDGNEIYRIKCGESISELFEDYIQKRGNSILNYDPKPKEKEQVLIRDCYKYFFDNISLEIDKLDSDDRKIKKIKALRKRIENLLVIQMIITREEDAYEIFEATNARGVDLSVADLLKNLILKNIPSQDDKDLAKEIWSEITNNIHATNTEMKRFIRYFWISKYAFVTEKKLFKSIKNRIDDWEGFLDNLWKDSINYNMLLEGTKEDWNETKDGSKIFKSVLALKIMKVSQCYVLLMTLLRNYDKLGTNPAKLFKFIEKFTYLYSAICKLPGNQVEKIYSKYARQIDKTINDAKNNKHIPARIQSNFESLKKELISVLPTKELFVENFMKLSYKNSSQSRLLIKYTFAQFEDYFTTGEKPIDFELVNIEHILPRSPDKEWKLKKTDIKPYVNKLGNLTLVSKKFNSKAGNKVLKKKLPELEKSEIRITQKIVEDIKDNDYLWNEQVINNRQCNFAEMAYDTIWKLS